MYFITTPRISCYHANNPNISLSVVLANLLLTWAFIYHNGFQSQKSGLHLWILVTELPNFTKFPGDVAVENDYGWYFHCLGHVCDQTVVLVGGGDGAGVPGEQAASDHCSKQCFNISVKSSEIVGSICNRWFTWGIMGARNKVNSGASLCIFSLDSQHIVRMMWRISFQGWSHPLKITACHFIVIRRYNSSSFSS